MKEAISWLCVKGNKGVSWVNLALDPDNLNPSKKLTGKWGVLVPLFADRGLYNKAFWGYQN